MRYVQFNTIENYYQRLVTQLIISEYAGGPLGDVPGALEDIACLALNQLPPRYVRHAVDTAFYLSVEEQQAMIQRARAAVERAANFVNANPREALTGEMPQGELPG
jgi:competence protein ComFB